MCHRSPKLRIIEREQLLVPTATVRSHGHKVARHPHCLIFGQRNQGSVLQRFLNHQGPQLAGEKVS